MSSESESDPKDQHTEIASGRTVCEKIDESSKPGTTPVRNIFRKMFGPTEFAKRHIMKGKVKTALSLIIDHRIMERIKTCTKRAHSNKNRLAGGRAGGNSNFLGQNE